MPGLIDFAHWFLKQPIETLAPVEIYNGGTFATMVLYRDPPFQAELAIMWPMDKLTPCHRHPHIDAYECFLYGDIPFFINGKLARGLVLPEFLPRLVTKVDSTDWHSVGVIPKGGSFISIQQWLDDVAITSVCMDWEGVPLSKEQNKLLHDKSAFWKRTTRRQMGLE